MSKGLALTHFACLPCLLVWPCQKVQLMPTSVLGLFDSDFYLDMGPSRAFGPPCLALAGPRRDAAAPRFHQTPQAPTVQARRHIEGHGTLLARNRHDVFWDGATQICRTSFNARRKDQT